MYCVVCRLGSIPTAGRLSALPTGIYIIITDLRTASVALRMARTSSRPCLSTPSTRRRPSGTDTTSGKGVAVVVEVGSAWWLAVLRGYPSVGGTGCAPPLRRRQGDAYSVVVEMNGRRTVPACRRAQRRLLQLDDQWRSPAEFYGGLRRKGGDEGEVSQSVSRQKQHRRRQREPTVRHRPPPCSHLSTALPPSSVQNSTGQEMRSATRSRGIERKTKGGRPSCERHHNRTRASLSSWYRAGWWRQIEMAGSGTAVDGWCGVEGRWAG